MNFQIDDAFIAEWERKYDETENDEYETATGWSIRPKYRPLITYVAEEMRSCGIVSEATCRRIYTWKAARAINSVMWSQWTDVYAPALREAISAPAERKLLSLRGLRGIGAPTGSTILHFIHPDSMPIIDQRTVGVLFKHKRVLTQRTGFEQYKEFRDAINAIRCKCPRWSLRQLDRALFAYHKQSGIFA